MDFQRSGITPRSKERINTDNKNTLNQMSVILGIIFVLSICTWGYFTVKSPAYLLGKNIERQTEVVNEIAKNAEELNALQKNENTLRSRLAGIDKNDTKGVQNSDTAEPPSKPKIDRITIMNIPEAEASGIKQKSTPKQKPIVKKTQVSKVSSVSEVKKVKDGRSIELVPYKKNASREQQEKIDYVWHSMITTHNLGRSIAKRYLYIFEGENGLWTTERKSKVVGTNGYYDHGLCQINKGYHPEIVKDPKFLTDWKWQAERCIDFMKSGVRFYADTPSIHARVARNFAWYPKK